MKRNFLRYVSCLMALIILISITTTTITPGLTVLAVENVLSVDGKTEEESIEDAKLSKSITGDWKRAKKDGVVPPYGQFHYDVQNYIMNKYPGITDEHTVTFRDGLIPSGNKSGTGRADLYKESEKIAFLWEIKPGSYLKPDKLVDCLLQLNSYVYDTVVEPSVTEYRVGNTPYIDGNTMYLKGNLSLSDFLNKFEGKLSDEIDLEELKALDISFDGMVDKSGKYTILIAYLPSGIILYWFVRIPDYKLDPPNPPTEEIDLSVFSWLFGNAFFSYWAQLKRNSGDGSVPILSPAPVYNLTPSIIPKENPFSKPVFEGYAEKTPSFETYETEPALQRLCLILGGAVVIGSIHNIINEKYSSNKMSTYAAWAASGAFTPEEILDMLQPAFEAYPEEFEALENYVYYGTGESIYDGISSNEEDLNKEIQGESDNFDKAAEATPPRDPLIIHFASTDEIEFTSLDEGVNFDLDANGFAEKTAWTKNADGFLAIDRNQDGVINNGSELFGDKTTMYNGEIASTGFEALSSYDRDGNGRIDKNDPIFKELLIWFDVENKGFTDAGELEPIEKQDVSYIDLNYFHDAYESNTTANETGTKKEETSYVVFIDADVKNISEFWFSVDTSDTTQDGEITVGNVPSILQAIENDDTNELLVNYLCFEYADDVAVKRYYLKKILYFITDANKIAADNRGGNIDARDLHVIEQFMGREFVGVSGSSPNAPAAVILKDIYADIENMYFSILSLNCEFGDYMRTIYAENDSDGDITLNLSIFNFIIGEKLTQGENVDSLVYSLGVYLKAYDSINDTNVFSEYSANYSEISSHLSEIVMLADTEMYTFIGTTNVDNFHGTGSTDYIFGDDESDILFGKTGNDLLYGGCGDDTLTGGAGDDLYILEYNHGNDTIYDTKGDNKLFFTDDFVFDAYNISVGVNGGFILTNKYTDGTISLPDFLTNPLNYDFIFNGETQTLGGGEPREVIEGTAEDNYLEAGDGFNVFYGGDGNDTLAGGVNMDFMYGENGDDLLLGRNGVNVLFGGTGNDTIYDGDDGSYLNGGDGDDSLYGGGGADVLDGGAGNDYLQADHGNDTYVFGKGYDTDTINASSDMNTVIIHGYRPTDMINTRNAHNDLIINFKNSDDCLIIDHFFDYNSNRDFNFVFDNGTVLGQYDITAKYAPIDGTDADEWLAIQNSDDGIIHGNGGNDGVSGGSGNDELYGDSGDDTLYGNDGNEILDGGTGTDGLNGGNGTDTYIFAKGYGNDTVNEWGSDHSIIKLTDINSDEVTVTDQYGSNLLLSVIDMEDTLVISNFKWGQATYTFEFADGAVATVNKDTWTFEFSQLPIFLEEEEVTTSDTTTTVTDETTVETEVSLETTEDEEVQSTEESDTAIETENTDSEVIVETEITTTNDLGDEYDSVESEEVSEQTDSQEVDSAENVSEDVTEERGSNIIDETETSVETNMTE